LGKLRPAGSADNSAILVVPNVKKQGRNPNSPSPFWVFTTCYGKAVYTCTYTHAVRGGEDKVHPRAGHEGPPV